MKIYTRRGDDGSTGLQGGSRVSKSSLRVTTYGTVDELNAALGWVRAAGVDSAMDLVLEGAQETCFRLGAWLSANPGQDPGVGAITAEDVGRLEAAIDDFEAGLEPLKNFVMPGGCEAASRLHIARTISRRAERKAVELSREDTVAPSLLAWLNRISDLLFVLARAANRNAGVADVPWTPRG